MIIEHPTSHIESILRTAGIFSDVDIHFARFIARFGAQDEPHVFLTAALASRATGSGDICLDLASAAGTLVSEKQGGGDAVVCPSLVEWRKKLISIKLLQLSIINSVFFKSNGFVPAGALTAGAGTRHAA